MQAYLQWIEKRFQSYSAREQLLVKLSLTIFILLVLYTLIIQPIQQTRDEAVANVQKQQNLHAWLQTQIQATQFKPTQQRPRYTGNLLQLINQTAAQQQITLGRIQPTENVVTVTIEQVRFNILANWLSNLENRGITVVSLEADELGNGLVKVRRLGLSQ